METRLSRLSGDRQYGPDNGLQSGWGGWGGEEGWDKATGEEGAERRISLQSTDTLLNYSALSLPPHTPAFASHTHTHHFNLTLVNEAREQRRSPKPDIRLHLLPQVLTPHQSSSPGPEIQLTRITHAISHAFKQK